MSLTFNNVRVPPSGHVRFNGAECARIRFNGVEVWRRQITVYPGAGIANTENTGYPPYFTYSDQDGTLIAQAYGGTEQGAGVVLVGPFSTLDTSRLFFDTLQIYVQNPFSHAIVSLAGADGSELMRLAEYQTVEDSDYTRTLTPADVFTPPQRQEVYLRLDVAAGATHRGWVSRITLTGLILE